MLRKIQMAAAGVAATFSALALIDLLLAHLGKLSTDAIFGASPVLTDMPFVPSVHGISVFLLGVPLVVAAIIAFFSVRHSQRLSHQGDYLRLDAWRRLTWGTSIIETAGCLLFVFSGTLVFLPATIALLLVGVAELAAIMQEVDARTAAPITAAHRPTTRV